MNAHNLVWTPSREKRGHKEQGSNLVSTSAVSRETKQEELKEKEENIFKGKYLARTGLTELTRK